MIVEDGIVKGVIINIGVVYYVKVVVLMVGMVVWGKIIIGEF